MAEDPLEPRQCSARSKRSGERCRRAPMLGQGVCAMHGGKSPGAVEKAAERQAEAEAEKTIAALVPLLGSVEPVKDPVDLLARMLGVLEGLADNVAGRVNELQGKVATGADLGRLRAEVVLLDRVQDRIVTGASKLAALGIAERQVELAAGQAEIMVAAFRAGLAAGGSLVLPEVRDTMLAAFLDALPGGRVVASELEGAS